MSQRKLMVEANIECLKRECTEYLAHTLKKLSALNGQRCDATVLFTFGNKKNRQADFILTSHRTVERNMRELMMLVDKINGEGFIISIEENGKRKIEKEDMI